jgi:hypothetical protein
MKCAPGNPWLDDRFGPLSCRMPKFELPHLGQLQYAVRQDTMFSALD